MDEANHPVTSVVEGMPGRAGELLEKLRAAQPRVHAITNAAAQVFTANLLLAAGAIPSLTIAVDEVAAFAARASALLVNLGTMDAERYQAFPIAIEAARQNRKPWVLDPVFVDASPVRLAAARNLITKQPTILHCNAAEFLALSAHVGREITPEQVRKFAFDQGLTLALTGAVDIVSDGMRILQIHNGHPLMNRTTAMGCAGTALIAAFASLTDDPMEAASAALTVVGVAGELAGKQVDGPGSFPAHFLDVLYDLTPAAIAANARLS